jgi:sec-independent protein translocase protein TatA
MFTNLGFLGIGTTELVVILVIILLLFGSKKLPELSRSVGQSMGELRKGLDGDKDTKDQKNQSDTSA